jgi:glycosyltransferase 2 family protein
LKKVSAILAILGLLLATVIVGYLGFDSIVGTLAVIGWSGFVTLLIWQTGLFLVLGAAWELIVPRRPSAPPWTFLWGRMVRDSAGNCLPLSQMGGFVLGARAVTLHGVSWPRAAASTVVDVTMEFLAQIAFAVVGLTILLIRAPGSSLAGPLAGALLAAVAAGVGFIWAQYRAAPVFTRLGRRIAREWFVQAGEGVDAVQGELREMYKRSLSIALGAALHLAGWIGTGVAAWLAYSLLGADIDLASVLAVEALLSAVLGLAFLVPGSLGVQEAGYALFGTIFGLPPELSIGVSLLRRAKDLALGIPILLVWQVAEARRLRIAAGTSS